MAQFEIKPVAPWRRSLPRCNHIASFHLMVHGFEDVFQVGVDGVVVVSVIDHDDVAISPEPAGIENGTAMHGLYRFTSFSRDVDAVAESLDVQTRVTVRSI